LIADMKSEWCLRWSS